VHFGGEFLGRWRASILVEAACMIVMETNDVLRSLLRVSLNGTMGSLISFALPRLIFGVRSSALAVAWCASFRRRQSLSIFSRIAGTSERAPMVKNVIQ
jgi:hypothetical protein